MFETTPVPSRPLLPAYVPAATAPEIPLKLDSNEGRGIPSEKMAKILSRCSQISSSRYPPTRPLEEQLAARWNLKPSQVLVTAGADDALHRLCRTFLGPEREAVVPVPTFEMILRYAHNTGATLRTVPWWRHAWPREPVLRALTERTGLVAVVSPNNPTGAVATRDDVESLCRAAPRTLVALDHAYVEFADEDLSSTVLQYQNAVVVRTFSKAWGLAGLRIGCVMGHESVIAWLRSSGEPWPVSALSLAVAQEWLAEGNDSVAAYVSEVRKERTLLTSLLRASGAEVWDSQGNFVLVRPRASEQMHTGLAAQGIGVRLFRGQPFLEGCLRITCPGDAAEFAFLESTLRSLLGGGK